MPYFRNTDIIDTCIVFRWWHIRSHTDFLLTLLVIVFLGILYQYLRVLQRKLDVRIAQSLISTKGNDFPRGRDRSNGPRTGSSRTSPHGFDDSHTEELGLLSGRKIQPNGWATPATRYWGMHNHLLVGSRSHLYPASCELCYMVYLSSSHSSLCWSSWLTM